MQTKPDKKRNHSSKNYISEQKYFDGIDQKNSKKQKEYLTEIFTQNSLKIDRMPIIPDRLNQKKSKPYHPRLFSRQMLNKYIIKNYITIFLNSLPERIKNKMFMFGFGRTLSNYNDIGVHICSDFDFNIIVRNLTNKDLLLLQKRLSVLKKEMWREYKIEVEINPAFTLLTFDQLTKNTDISLAKKGNEYKVLQNLMFYKLIEKSYIIFNDDKKIREYLFSKTKPLPDIVIIDQLIGINGKHYTYGKLKRGDGLGIKFQDNIRKVENVIGSTEFILKLKRGNELLLEPDEWYFSMKYLVNRTYDCVSILSYIGYTLEQIGITEADMKYLRKVHIMMLTFQEIKYVRLDSLRFGATHEKCDFTYIKNTTFTESMKTASTNFLKYFMEIMIKQKTIPYPDDLILAEKHIKNHEYSKALWKGFYSLGRRTAKIADKLLLQIHNPNSILRKQNRQPPIQSV